MDELVTVPYPLGGAAQQVRDRWQRRSAESAWAHPTDWWDPAVDALVEAVAEGRDPVVAAELLGRARAEAGVGLPESLDDLAALYRVVGVLVPPFPVVRAFTSGWADAGVAPVRTAACEDPLTGLATASYLRTRLGELYRAAVAARALVTDTTALLVLDASIATADPWQRVARGCVLADCLREVFVGGEPLVVLGAGRVGAVVVRDEHLGGTVARLRDLVDVRLALAGLDRVSRRPPRVWVEPLPADFDQALALLTELER